MLVDMIFLETIWAASEIEPQVEYTRKQQQGMF